MIDYFGSLPENGKGKILGLTDFDINTFLIIRNPLSTLGISSSLVIRNKEGYLMLLQLVDVIPSVSTTRP